MKSVEEIIFRLHNNLMEKQGIHEVSSREIEIRPKNGINSETIVELILDIEDELDIELDNYLAMIRECKTIGLFIDIVEKAYKEAHGK